MKVSVIGAGFVGLTTACVIASRGIEVTIEDSNKEKLSQILNGVVPFFEPGLEDLLNKVLVSGNLKLNNEEIKPDLTIIAVGTPSRSSGSINTLQVELALKDCNRYLPPGSLVAIKSTVVPGTTRRLQSQLELSNLELLMIPEFLREGSAVSDALLPDRNVIGSQSQEVANRATDALGIKPESCIFTSTFSAESIKYLSNAFLATCISFTNETFASFNEDKDFDVSSVILGWHSDRRFLPNNNGVAGITSYLVPGPGFGGSCFPKDVRALRSSIKTAGKQSKILDAVIDTNQTTLEETAKWIASQLPPSEKYVLLGMGFKDDTDDLRESPSLMLAQSLTGLAINGFWHDKYVQVLPNDANLGPATEDIIRLTNYFILMHHSDYYRELIRKRATKMDKQDELTVLALRNQPPIEGINWIYPRSGRKSKEKHE
jgi:UDPglucose 6-dehydrogenase